MQHAAAASSKTSSRVVREGGLRPALFVLVQLVTPGCISLKTRKIAGQHPVSTGIMNRKKSLIAVVLVVILATAALLVYRTAFAKETTPYRFVAIERGDIKSTVSATG